MGKWKLKLRGVNADRCEVDGNELEGCFAICWEKENRDKYQMSNGSAQYGQLLGILLKDAPTKRDELVAATVIQWLGSHVGQCFLNRVYRYAPSGSVEAPIRRRKTSKSRKTINKVEKSTNKAISLILNLRNEIENVANVVVEHLEEEDR